MDPFRLISGYFRAIAQKTYLGLPEKLLTVTAANPANSQSKVPTETIVRVVLLEVQAY